MTKKKGNREQTQWVDAGTGRNGETGIRGQKTEDRGQQAGGSGQRGDCGLRI